MIVDLVFPVLCQQTIPVDHGYLIYSAVSKILPDTHGNDGFGIHPISGRQIGGRTLQLTEYSKLAVRVDTDKISRFLPLAGKSIRLIDRQIRIGVPQVRAMVPSVALRSRLVTIKLPDTASQQDTPARESFQAAIARQLSEKGMSGQVKCELGKRRTVRIKDKEVVGYEVLLENLSAEESLIIQERGLGGRRHMGCGIFMPVLARGPIS